MQSSQTACGSRQRSVPDCWSKHHRTAPRRWKPGTEQHTQYNERECNVKAESTHQSHVWKSDYFLKTKVKSDWLLENIINKASSLSWKYPISNNMSCAFHNVCDVLRVRVNRVIILKIRDPSISLTNQINNSCDAGHVPLCSLCIPGWDTGSRRSVWNRIPLGSVSRSLWWTVGATEMCAAGRHPWSCTEGSLQASNPPGCLSDLSLMEMREYWRLQTEMDI